MEPIVTKEHSNFIYWVAHLVPFSSIHALYRGYYDFSALQLLMFLTSINYWKHPIYGPRRNIDMATTAIIISYHAWLSPQAEYAAMAYSVCFTGILFYPASWYYQNKGYLWVSTYCHSIMHLLFFMCANILYSGYIYPLTQ